MHILFVSHSFPPIMGGVENQNYNLSQGLQELAQVTLIANRKGKRCLPFFLVRAFVQGLLVMRSADACLLGNGVLSPLGALLRLFYPQKKFFCIIHGLDITYANRKGWLPLAYKKINIPLLKTFDRLIMVGHAAIDEAVKLNIKRELCVFVPNGITVDDFRELHHRSELSAFLGQDANNKKVLLRLSRFVPHKGTSWFIEHVMPRLPEDIVLIAAGQRVKADTPGDPDDFTHCQSAIARMSLTNRVRLLPSIPFAQVKVLLNTVDLVISPNIKVHGSMEGFGLNVLEACACERVVVASRLEGLQDAIKEGVNGFLVAPGNAKAWSDAVKSLLGSDQEYLAAFGKQARQYVEAHLSWDGICKKYIEVLHSAEPGELGN